MNDRDGSDTPPACRLISSSALSVTYMYGLLESSRIPSPSSCPGQYVFVLLVKHNIGLYQLSVAEVKHTLSPATQYTTSAPLENEWGKCQRCDRTASCDPERASYMER